MLFYTLILDTEEEKSLLEQLYSTHHKAMFAMAFDILKEQMAAEDAVHSAVLKILKHLKKLGQMEPTAQWRFLAKITYTTAIDLYRKRSREWKHSQYGEIEEWKLPPFLHEMFWELPEENRIVEAIKCMPPLYRDAFILKYHYQYNTNEIATMLGLTENSVRQRISRGKRRLELILKERGVLQDASDR